MTRKQRDSKYAKRKTEERRRDIAVLDMETDPFDNVGKGRIQPFVACLYSEQFEPVIIWEENERAFAQAVFDAIERLPGKFTVYAHNGGKFDFMFLVHLLRGDVSFKGRGIMAANIGRHYLRDSFHIIPEKLAGYHKEQFDYSKMRRDKRHTFREEIISYLISDCKYLLEVVTDFVEQFGLKLSIGQAAMAELKRSYDVAKFSDGWDNYVRDYFFGGRVECLAGRGAFVGDYKLYDVNSMYPYVMATRKHPTGGFHDYTMRRGAPSNDTCFVQLDCRNNGALIARADSGETTATITEGRFFTTIHEYEVALKYGLISDVRVLMCLDCAQQTDFSEFVLPLYDKRLITKKRLDEMRRAGLEAKSEEWFATKRDDLFYKLLLNNAYGKFAQNPRRFKQHWLTDENEQPPDAWFKTLSKEQNASGEFALPRFECEEYWIWEKPAPTFTFNNVGVAASITGAARAVLLEALQHAREPIYCDTDSIICKELTHVDLDKTALGAWDIEAEFSEVRIAGKKLYATSSKTGKESVKAKGLNGLIWSDMLELIDGGEKKLTNFGPTLTKTGKRDYITRTVRATAR